MKYKIQGIFIGKFFNEFGTLGQLHCDLDDILEQSISYELDKNVFDDLFWSVRNSVDNLKLSVL